MTAKIAKVGNVYYRVSDMDADVRLYQDVLGLTLKFRDGDNWAAFDVSGTILALEGGAAPNSGRSGATVSLRVEGGLDEFIAKLRNQGAKVSDPAAGGHERRAELTDNSGNILVLYEPLAR